MPKSPLALAAVAILLTAGSSPAVVAPERSPLESRERRPAGLDVEPVLRRLAQLDAAAAARRSSDLHRLGVAPENALLDARGGRWATLLLARPLVPGTGVGNTRAWTEAGLADAPADEAALARAVWRELSSFLAAHRDALGVEPGELVARVGMADGGAIVQIHADRVVDGVAVRGATLTATVNHGNLILLGTERWGDVEVSTDPSRSSVDAESAVGAYLAPFVVTGFAEPTHLELLPLGRGSGARAGYSHRLVWIVRPVLPGFHQRFEAAVDAHSGEILLFQDTNLHATRNVRGGVYPLSYDGQLPDGVEIPGYPMPFARVAHDGGTAVTDSGGNLFDLDGVVTTQIEGPYVRVLDDCGAISESSADGDLDLGVSALPDCDTPAGASPGNTHSARTAFYELNRIGEMARGYWPSAQGGPASAWLHQQLTTNVNVDSTCGAFWNGSTVSFYREGSVCANTGQLAGAIDHEWGHGLDDNGTNGGISTPAEGIADLYAAIRLGNSCIGRGFFVTGTLCTGYGDPCTPASGCTGLREVDFAHRASGEPHTVAWVNGNPSCGSPHCRGALVSEAVWDLAKRDLPDLLGMDDPTATVLTSWLLFRGADNVGTWFVLGNGDQGGCAATGGYLQFLAVDDDNGTLLDGTPHMPAILSAFDRHEIACATPAVGNGGCANAPSQAPVLTVTPGDTTAALSWTAVPDAARYGIYRADGELPCSSGRIPVGTTTATSFENTGLQNGRTYAYLVAAFGVAAPCMGPASACVTVVPGAGDSMPFLADFEEGDLSEWSVTQP